MASKWRTAIRGVLDRDRPIFLQLRGGGWVEKCLWYVIEVEEKEVDTRKSSSGGQGNSSESSSTKGKGEGISTCCVGIRRRLADFGMRDWIPGGRGFSCLGMGNRSCLGCDRIQPLAGGLGDFRMRMGFSMAGELLRSLPGGLSREGNKDDAMLMVRNKVRRVPVPVTEFEFTCRSNFVVCNSRFYLIGGADSPDEEEGGIRYLDLSLTGGKKKGWTPPQTPLGGWSQIRAIAREDGWVCTMGLFGSNYLVHPCTGRREKLPEIPVPDPCPLLLGFSNKHILVHSSRGTQIFMLCYDLESGKWEELEQRPEQMCSEYWSPGVVLYNGRYLFSYGNFNPTTNKWADGFEFEPYHLDEKKKKKNKWILKESYKDIYTPGIYVFDIEQRKWLSDKVEGLPNDGKALPLPPKFPKYQQEDDVNDYSPTIKTPYLLQIGVNNKLALVWNDKDKVCWSKFIIHPHSPPAVSDDEPPCFRAQLLSNGVRKFAQHQLWSCAQGL